MKCNQRSVFTGTEGLCLLLKRLAYPCRYSDLIHQFGRPVPVLGMITNKVIDYIYDVHHHKITTWNNDILNPVALQMYADAILAKGAALTSFPCFALRNSTAHPNWQHHLYKQAQITQSLQDGGLSRRPR